MIRRGSTNQNLSPDEGLEERSRRQSRRRFCLVDRLLFIFAFSGFLCTSISSWIAIYHTALLLSLLFVRFSSVPKDATIDSERFVILPHTAMTIEFGATFATAKGVTLLFSGVLYRSVFLYHRVYMCGMLTTSCIHGQKMQRWPLPI